jgi:DNA-binding response OmpR family regulator
MRALIVDDEPAIRELTARALKSYSFTCDEASDGEEGWEMASRRDYQVVITDLRMPKRNGHSLAVELTARGSNRPLVVVLTGILEPRLAEDLIKRGVDDITFKPVDFTLFGAKIKALCERRLKRSEANEKAVQATTVPTMAGKPQQLTAREIEIRLDSLAGSLPVSAVAFEVANLTDSGNATTLEISRSIARDPSLTMEVLRIANSACFNPRGKRIDDLQMAIARLGQRKISEMALASTTIDSLKKTVVPWLNVDLLWQRSVATSLAIEHLQTTAGVGANDEGLFLSSLLLPMSRLVMALAFPELYERHVTECAKTGQSVAGRERQFLSVSPARALARILERWKLTPRLFKPLQHAGLSYAEIGKLGEPLRSKVDRLRVAEVFGQLAVGQFEPWDEIDFPASDMMRRVRGDNVAMIIDQVRTNMADLSVQRNAAVKTIHSPWPTDGEVRYFKLTVEPYDFLMPALAAFKSRVTSVPRIVACDEEPAVINCLDVSDERLNWFLEDMAPSSSRVFVSRGQLPMHSHSFGTVVQLPASWKTFSDGVGRLAKDKR